MACNYGGEASSSRATRLTLASAAKRIEELERQLAVQQSQEPAPRRADVARSKSSPLSAPILHHAQAEESSAVHEMLYGVDRMPNATGHPEYFGSSSPTATRYLLERLAILPRDGQETQKMASRDRVSIWHSDRRQLRFSTTAHPGSSWLPRRLADKYIRCYFRTVHRVCPALEQVHFMERYERFWQNLPTEGRGYTRWTAVLYMALALGHQLCHVAQPLPDSEADLGHACFKAGKALLTDVAFHGGDMSIVNALMLAVSLNFDASDLCCVPRIC
jgi:hypothetical protein